MQKMLPRTSIKYRLFLLSCGASLIMSLSFSVMWLFSYNFFTSLGIDTDRAEGSNVISKYYRIRWPGNGSFWIGGGGFRRSDQRKPLEPFDLGGVFFKAPKKVQPKSYWNSMGFWLIRESELNQWQFWIGVPSWFPILLTGALPFRYWILHQQRKK